MTTTLTGAYMAVLLGSLVTSCPKNRRTISAHLPSLEPLALMIEEFIEFQKTLLQVNENASCMGRQSQKILTMLHSMVQELRT